MRLISTLCLLLFSSASFSQLYDMIKVAEYNPKRVSEAGNNIYMCGMRGYMCGMRGNLSIVTNVPTIQPAIVRIDSVKPLHISPTLNIRTTKSDISEKATSIKLRCMRTLTEDDNPLIVIDGVPIERNCLSSINPNDIETIHILKQSDAAAIYGCRAAQGVIIITTKQGKFRKFIIKDFLGGDRIPGATVIFISADKRDTLMLSANDSGVVSTDKLKRTVKYSMTITSVGFKNYISILENINWRREQEIFLMRDIKECDEVVLNSYGSRIISCRFGCRIPGIYIKTDSVGCASEKTEMTEIKVYPNPVQRGNVFNIQFSNHNRNDKIVRIANIDGKNLLQQVQKAIEGKNVFQIQTDSRWAAGIYIVQIYENGKLLASDKLIIQ